MNNLRSERSYSLPTNWSTWTLVYKTWNDKVIMLPNLLIRLSLNLQFLYTRIMFYLESFAKKSKPIICRARKWRASRWRRAERYTFTVGTCCAVQTSRQWTTWGTACLKNLPTHILGPRVGLTTVNIFSGPTSQWNQQRSVKRPNRNEGRMQTYEFCASFRCLKV